MKIHLAPAKMPEGFTNPQQRPPSFIPISKFCAIIFNRLGLPMAEA